MSSFSYTARPCRVLFGAGTLAKLPSELFRQNLKAALVLSTPFQQPEALAVTQQLGTVAVGIFSEATMHTPLPVTERGIQEARLKRADCVISIGGGSTTGLGKAISIRTGLPHISIPTTYAGSEMTPHLGETVDGIKTTRSDPAIQPATVLYDVNLTMSLPGEMSATSGINAIAHAVEALYAPDTNPIIRLMALEGVRVLAESLPLVATDESNAEVRYQALYGAWLCGTCLGSTTMSLHHKLCHVIGGSFNMPHAETHTILLPHTIAYNIPSMPEVNADLAGVLPCADGNSITGLNNLLEKLGVRRALQSYGLKEGDIEKAAMIAVKNPYANPRPVEKEKIQELLRRAWAGEAARADM
ncbi:hypothetical protein IFR04_006185 [Cadophora malorum]|uniref:Maleylacetate reductase n=1 Tax=Cadophora malorum TaxID=108018 RepID=A0A8H7TJG6_9HELO|nr:hypothetical protein IFR04_006185 [Cadophora malorum]